MDKATTAELISRMKAACTTEERLRRRTHSENNHNPMFFEQVWQRLQEQADRLAELEALENVVQEAITIWDGPMTIHAPEYAAIFINKCKQALQHEAEAQHVMITLDEMPTQSHPPEYTQGTTGQGGDVAGMCVKHKETDNE